MPKVLDSTIADGVEVRVESDAVVTLTAALTALTHTAPVTPDYAIQELVQNTGFGFVTADEGHTVLKVLVNLAVRLGELETKLKTTGMFE
jgi:hypothetical protein